MNNTLSDVQRGSDSCQTVCSKVPVSASRISPPSERRRTGAKHSQGRPPRHRRPESRSWLRESWRWEDLTVWVLPDNPRGTSRGSPPQRRKSWDFSFSFWEFWKLQNLRNALNTVLLSLKIKSLLSFNVILKTQVQSSILTTHCWTWQGLASSGPL